MRTRGLSGVTDPLSKPEHGACTRWPNFLENEHQLSQYQARSTIYTVMIQRTLFRQTKSLATCLRASPKPMLARSQFHPAIQIAPSSFRPISASRWYSTEPEKKDTQEQKGETKEADATSADAAKKELEAKDKEIVDLKVCNLISAAIIRPISNNYGRTNIYDRSPNFEICKSEPSVTCKPLKISPFRNSQRI